MILIYINIHEINIPEHSKKKEDVLNTILVKTHVEFRNRMETQIHIYSELKKELFSFLAKYM